MRDLIDKVDAFNKRSYGCWITPSGECFDVGYQHHEEYLMRLKNLDYTDALEQGYIRIVYPDQRTYWTVHCCATTTLLALRTLSKIASEHTEHAVYIDIDIDNDIFSYKVPDSKTMCNLIRAARSGNLVDNIVFDKYAINQD